MNTERTVSVFVLSGLLIGSLVMPAPCAPQPDRFAEFDRNGDGRVTSRELQRPGLFGRMDLDGDGSVTRSEARKAFQQWAAERPGSESQEGTMRSEPPMRRHPNVAYARMDGVHPKLLSLDLYAPTNAGPNPVMVMIHGGGWCMGDKANAHCAESKARHFVAEGYVYVSVNYRLSPAVKHPAHVQDVASALAWVHDKVARYGGDANHITIMGHSAGAHLAALVATDERYLKARNKDLCIVKGVVLLDGAGYDLPTHLTDPSGPPLRQMFLKAFGEDASGWKDPSPLFHVTPGKGIPPFLIFHAGKRRTAREQSHALAAALRKAGVDARIVNAADRDHGGMNACIGLPNDPYTATVMAFLERWSET